MSEEPPGHSYPDGDLGRGRREGEGAGKMATRMMRYGGIGTGEKEVSWWFCGSVVVVPWWLNGSEVYGRVTHGSSVLLGGGHVWWLGSLGGGYEASRGL